MPHLSGTESRIAKRMILKKIRSEKRKNGPDPPTLAFLEKAGVFPQKSKGFSLRGTPKNPWKRKEKRKKKPGKSENEKSKEIEKSKDWRVRGVESQ